MSWYGVSSLFVGGNVTCLGVDGSSELLWTGRASGHVASYGCTPRGLDGRYTGWRSSLSPLSTLRLDAGGVLSLGGNSVHYASRGGVCAFSLALAQPLTTSVDTPGRSTELALAGPASPLLLLNLNTKSITRQYVPPKPIAKLARGALLVAATTEGDVQLLDVRTKELVVSQTVKAHSGGVKELETQGDFVVTVGYTLRQSLALPDPFLKLHDVRFLRPLSPIPFPSPPALVKFHPKLSSTVLVLSAEGRGQMLDLKNLVSGHTGSLFQVETSGFLTTMAMAPTGEGLVVADTGGYVHLWSVGEGAKFCRYELDLEGPAERVRPELVNWLPDTPLNSIGMPHYEEPLLSLLPPSVEQHKRTPLAPVISPTILAGVKTVDFIGYAPYGTEERSKGRRNQVRSDKFGEDGVGGSKGVAGPLFRSEREREEARRRGRGVELDLGAELGKSVDEGSSRETLPGYYRKVEIKYSRFGVEDFDFGFYNKTTFSGLETHISNSYTNALLQALHYVQPIRKVLISHIFSSDCLAEHCLGCQVGFLLKMLEDAKGRNCQASNFLKVFGENGAIAALGLLDHDHSTSSKIYAQLIQTFNRFLLEHMMGEIDGDKSLNLLTAGSGGAGTKEGPLGQLIRVKAKSLVVCPCGSSTERDATFSVLDLIYPKKSAPDLSPNTNFFKIVESSLIRNTTTSRILCKSCQQNVWMQSRRTFGTSAGGGTDEGCACELPPILVINAGVGTRDELDFWQGVAGTKGKTTIGAGEPKRFLEDHFTVRRNGQGLSVTDAVVEGGVHYRLRSMVVQVFDTQEASHLVTFARTVQTEGEAGESWHIFNDFLVRPVGTEEALSFRGGWKIPAVLFYERTDLPTLLDFSRLPVEASYEILCQDITVSRNRDRGLVKHQPLRRDELPRRGTLVSIDAEFVSLQQEEAEYHSDGTKKVIRPSRMTLARVSVLRGEGPETGIPFIDDHIATSETVVDYLTEFSGIRAGDLDPFVSRHTLVPLKVAYKKLRLLVDLGCIFIGHGLNKDFRIINIFIPPSQIIDTVVIYHQPSRQRKLSLRFLAWAVLGQKIQTDTHDSIEDARMALQLFEDQTRREAEGTWEDKLEEVYREGKLTNFKVPESPKPLPSTTASPGPLMPPPQSAPPYYRSNAPSYQGRH